MGIAKERVIVRRGGAHGVEMKNNEATVKDSHFYNMATVFVEEGVPASTEEVRMNISEAFYSTSKPDNSFYRYKGTFHSHVELWTGPVNAKLTVQEFKERLGTAVGKDWRLLRVRERHNERLTKVYRDEKRMDLYGLHEGKQLAVQVLKEAERPGEEEVLVMAQLWNSSDWSLSEVKEFYVERSCSLKAFGAILSSLFGVPVGFAVTS